jgi:hypothetical protein
MDSNPEHRSLLETILERQPQANISAPGISVAGATPRTISLQEMVAATNRIIRNKGWASPYVVSYQDQDAAVLELNPNAWREQKKQLSRDLQFMTLQDLAKVFQHTGRTSCTVKVDSVPVGRFYRSPLEGWVWESTADEPQHPPSAKTLAQIIVIALLVFLLFMILLGFAHVVLRGPS